MEQFKNAQLVLLPTVNETNIIKGNRNKLYKSSEIPDINYNKLINPVWTYMSLYVISDDEIKENDYAYHKLDSKVLKITKDLLDGDIRRFGYKKVIATNNKSLTTPDKINLNKFWYLPELPEQFIEYFIDEYNKGNIITDVLVEYEKATYDKWFNNGGQPVFDTLKINPKDNTITIKKLKDSWNREEVVNLVKNALESSEALLDRDERWMGDILDCVFYNLNKEEFNNWIKENL